MKSAYVRYTHSCVWILKQRRRFTLPPPLCALLRRLELALVPPFVFRFFFRSFFVVDAAHQPFSI
ncbi:hypothetical protein TSAR_009879 [Trichomalopsis sarcophagae]|uniref:Uncharacterized protein n=1 Tax=Trichomalopsis sarcophagae TaxID=543379 RepID=A0A232ETE7_9HYME|nr:hypothetical protein TSAR_009879 [Trichomalopsis sarcophagae]